MEANFQLAHSFVSAHGPLLLIGFFLIILTLILILSGNHSTNKPLHKMIASSPALQNTYQATPSSSTKTNTPNEDTAFLNKENASRP